MTCGSFIFIRVAGIDQTPACRSNSPHVANRVSFERTAVSTVNFNASRPVLLASTASLPIKPGTSSYAIASRCVTLRVWRGRPRVTERSEISSGDEALDVRVVKHRADPLQYPPRGIGDGKPSRLQHA